MVQNVSQTLDNLILYGDVQALPIHTVKPLCDYRHATESDKLFDPPDCKGPPVSLVPSATSREQSARDILDISSLQSRLQRGQLLSRHSLIVKLLDVPLRSARNWQRRQAHFAVIRMYGIDARTKRAQRTAGGGRD